jgi:DNA topoisomerase-1
MARAFDARERARLRRERARRAQAEAESFEGVRAAREAGLVYVADSEPGIRRRRAGKGFAYRAPDGRKVSAPEAERIRKLAIPPAYTQVWICTHPRGHLQATGRDARQRKQYRYHPQWRAARDLGKFGRMVPFGKALPALRRRLRQDLARPGLPREKVLALVVTLLARTLIRVGNDEYARSNRSFGLSTLRDRHAEVAGGSVHFRFRGKSGQEHEVTLDDPRLAKLVKRCQELPGQALFQYLDEAGIAHPIDSGQVNDYLRDAMGTDFTAKDFRTWGGTLDAIALFGRTPLPERGGERALAQEQMRLIKEVAGRLGNTPAVCRASYIHPAVFDAWRDGSLQRALAAHPPHTPREHEKRALVFLSRYMRGRGKSG